jgi:hypothetical protein
MMGENIARNVELTWNNKLIYMVHLVGYVHSCITTHGFMNVKFTFILLAAVHGSRHSGIRCTLA